MGASLRAQPALLDLQAWVAPIFDWPFTPSNSPAAREAGVIRRSEAAGEPSRMRIPARKRAGIRLWFRLLDVARKNSYAPVR